MVDTEESVHVEHHEDVLVVILDRPRRANALTLEMAQTVADHLQGAAVSADVHGVVLTGAGGAFCAGGDFGTLQQLQAMDPYARRGAFRAVQAVARTLTSLPVPTAAVIDGPAAGAGFDLALCVDYRVATPAAVFRTAFTHVGLVPDLGGSWLLPRAVGSARARRLLIGNERLDAETALDWGIVDAIAAVDEAIDGAATWVRRAGAGATGPAVREVREALEAGWAETFDQSLERAAQTQALLMDTPEHHERLAALRTDRPTESG